MRFSVEVVTQETFEKIRRGFRFELVKSNLKLVIDYCDQPSLLPMRTWGALLNEKIQAFSNSVTRRGRA